MINKVRTWYYEKGYSNDDIQGSFCDSNESACDGAAVANSTISSANSTANGTNETDNGQAGWAPPADDDTPEPGEDWFNRLLLTVF